MRIKVSDKLPKYDTVVIVWSTLHDGPALGMLRQPSMIREKNYWEVQPWWEVDYWTYDGVESWQPIEGEP